MKRFRDIMPTLAVALLVVATSAAPALGQQEDGRRGGRRRGFDWQNMSEEQREQMRERFEQRREEVRREQTQRIREDLELTEEEYSAIEPMLDRVRQLSRQSLTAGRDHSGDRGRGGPGGPGRGGNPFGDDTENLSPQGQELRETSVALRETLRNEGASSDEIKGRLAALRKARVAMQDALRQAREELRGFVTPKQEATLVLQGEQDTPVVRDSALPKKRPGGDINHQPVSPVRRTRPLTARRMRCRPREKPTTSSRTYRELTCWTSTFPLPSRAVTSSPCRRMRRWPTCAKSCITRRTGLP